MPVAPDSAPPRTLVIRVRVRFLVTVALVFTVAGSIWAWETQLWGARYRPWNTRAATMVEQGVAVIEQYGVIALQVQLPKLSALGPPVVRPMLPQMTHPNPVVREWATGVMGQVGDWSVQGPIVERLEDVNPRVRQAAVLSLHRLRLHGALEQLWDHSTDASARTRAAVAMALGDLPAPCNVPVLITLTEDADGAVRLAAAVSLGRLGDPRAIPALVVCLREPTGLTPRAAARSLAMITGLRVHRDGNLWMAWWALHQTT